MSWDDPSWKKAAEDYHADRKRNVRHVQPSEEAIAAAMAKQDRRNYTDLSPTFATACRRADAIASLQRRRDNVVPFERRAATSTVEALVYGLRDGIDALPTHSERLRRLSELSETQLHEVCARLQNFKPAIARPWTEAEIVALVSIWTKIHA